METLTTAHGYFDLGLFTEAWETLDVLPVEVRESNEAMELRLKILAATERWEKLEWLAEGLTESTKGWASPWFYLVMGKAKTGHPVLSENSITAGRAGNQAVGGFWGRQIRSVF